MASLPLEVWVQLKVLLGFVGFHSLSYCEHIAGLAQFSLPLAENVINNNHKIITNSSRFGRCQFLLITAILALIDVCIF